MPRLRILADMKNLFQLIAAIGIVSLFGCPYSSEVPLSEPEMKIDETLLGKYQSVEDQAIESRSYLEIKQETDNSYKVLDSNYSDSDSTFSTANYIAFETKVKGVSFFNLMEEGRPPYMLYRLDRISSGSFRLTEVTDNIDEKFDSSEQLRAFIGKHKDLSFLYSKEETVYRRMD